jgi:hypothetical protein
MPNYTDPYAVAERLRSATASLTREEDTAAVRVYLQELEQAARARSSRRVLLAGQEPA